MIHSVAQAAAQVPAYCTSGHGVLTQAQWSTCWKLGWNQPVNGAANAGAFAGHNVGPVLFGLLIVAALFFALTRRRGRSRTPATSK